MEQKVIFRDDQELQAGDLTNIELYAEQSVDDIVNDCVGTAPKFYGFPVSQTSSTEVNVAGGRIYFANGAVYYRNDTGGVPLNLFSSRPVANSKIIAVIGTPVTIETNVQARDFLINAETLETEPQSVTMTVIRQVNIGFIAGDENATPTPPPVDANSVVIAYVTMGPGGIQTINYVETNRMRSLQLAHERLDENDDFRAKIGSRLDTLGSEITGLQAALDGLAKQSMVTQIAFDVAQLKDIAGVPSNASSYDADHFLDTSKSDLTNAAYYALVEEGIRFPAIQSQIAQIGLANQYDASVSSVNNFLYPAFTPTRRISVVGNDRQVQISQYEFQTVQQVQLTQTQQVTRYGPTFTECSNSSWWQSGRYNPVTGIFKLAGKTYNVVDTGKQGYYGDGPWAHEILRLTQFWTDTVTTSYWDSITTTQGVNGTVVAQTFLNTQDGYLASLNLYFSSVAAAGDLTVNICQTTSDGSPDFNNVLATTVVPVGNIKAYPNPTPVAFTLPFLKKGSRYAISLVTPGNHSLCQVGGNKYAQGSFFNSTDGAWAQGDTNYDMAFEAYFASFNAARIEVAMQPLTLAGGIANIELNVQQTLPDGTQLVHMVQNNGEWLTIGPDDQLLGLPTLCQYKVVFIGTTDVMPSLGVGPNSQITTWRPANNFRHIAIARNLPAGVTTTKIQVNTRQESWDPLHHTTTCRILYGTNYATAKTYDLLTETTPIEDANARARSYTFNMPSAVSTYKVEIDGTTDAVLDTFHVAGRQDLAF